MLANASVSFFSPAASNIRFHAHRSPMYVLFDVGRGFFLAFVIASILFEMIADEAGYLTVAEFQGSQGLFDNDDHHHDADDGA